MRAMFLTGLQKILNTYLQLDSDTIARLQKLDGKRIELNIEDWNLRFYIMPQPQGLNLQSTIEGSADTIIRGKLDALFYLWLQKGSNSSLFKNRIQVEGDLETGEAIRNIMAEMDIDWEEHLSKYLGDGIAHKMGNFMRELKNISQQTNKTVERNLKEYLQFEANILPSKAEINQFIEDVSEIRHAVERAQARLQLLLKPRNIP